MKPVTSAENPRFKQLLKVVRTSRERRKTGLSILDGVHLIDAFIKAGGHPDLLVISEVGAASQEIVFIINNLQTVPQMSVADALFKLLSSVETPTGILAVIKIPSITQVQPETAGACVLLEDIQDPGNLGSILRSSAAAGVEEIYLSTGCADAWSPRTLRAGMGAHFALRIAEGVDLLDFVRRYGGKAVVACGNATRTVFETCLSGKTALVLGNEGAGVSAQLRETADLEVRIPMSKQVDSLNVAAAAAVLLFERVRQTTQDRTLAGL